MKTQGLDQGMRLETLPIRTVGKPVFAKYWVWLMDPRRVRVLEPFFVPRPEGGYYVIPAGFEFDGGSIPRWLLVLVVLVNQIMGIDGVLAWVLMVLVLVGLMLERFGLMLTAFAVHDFAVRYGYLIKHGGAKEFMYSVGDANRAMRRVNFATNDMILLGWVAHLAVVLGAWRAWRSYRNGAEVVPVNTLDFGSSPI